MAEFPELGKQCALFECSQLDFLPFLCDHCEETFCKKHRFPSDHDCNAFFLTSERKVTNPSDKECTKFWKCSFQDCGRTEVVHVICDICHATFCLAHRHTIDHHCPAINVKTNGEPGSVLPSTKKVVQEILDKDEYKRATAKSKANISASSAKNAAVATKVALMKIKMNAVGEERIAEVDRFYLQVFLPRNDYGGGGTKRGKAEAFFVSRFATIGRVIDDIASRLGLINNNNVPSAAKLRLFSHETGLIYPTCKTLAELEGAQGSAEHSVTVEEQTVTLRSGQSMILEYVENDGVVFLKDFEQYKL